MSNDNLLWNSKYLVLAFIRSLLSHQQWTLRFFMCNELRCNIILFQMKIMLASTKQNNKASKLLCLWSTKMNNFCLNSFLFRDLGLHALQNVGLFDPNALIHHNHVEICQNALHLSSEQRRICSRSPRIFSVSD